MVIKGKGIIISGLSLIMIIGALNYKIDVLNDEKIKLENKIIKIEKQIDILDKEIVDKDKLIKEKEEEIDKINKQLEETTKKYNELKNKSSETKTKSDTTTSSNKSVAAAPTTKTTSNYNISQSEIELLEKLVYREAGIESQAGQIAVANVVLNRVNSDLFPDTVTEVIYQKGQFQPVDNSDINNVKASDEVKASVQKALRGEKTVSDDTVYFYATWIRSNHPIRSHVQTTKTIGNHIFGK